LINLIPKYRGDIMRAELQVLSMNAVPLPNRSLVTGWMARGRTQLMTGTGESQRTADDGAGRSLAIGGQNQASALERFAVIMNQVAGVVDGGQRSVGSNGGGAGSAVQLPPVPSTPNAGATPGTGTSTPALEKKVIHTPFGDYDINAMDTRMPGIDAFGSTPMETYFMTHQPGEWKGIQNFRDEFEKLYGAAALVTLDRHGTIPKNVDPNWVTKTSVDSAAGRA
jgi:hypothetical protein